jgi:hypothetical protein|uniref:Uncharacterized protein n=1 Tax=Phaeodactylum tricornutum TaxID=2850 RepID=A0A8J9S419_PHATR
MSNSGASTPHNSSSSTPPPPPPSQSDPLTVGTRFVKQYYQVLSTTPDQIHRFYQPTSWLSAGHGSEPTIPATLETIQASLKSRFVIAESSTDPNNAEKHAETPIRFEFEHGAIDAQWSVQGGVLLVVTGQVLVPLLNEEKDTKKSFVHTFFLGSTTAAGNKKSYYVHNDILRFVYQPETVSTATPVAAPSSSQEESEEAKGAKTNGATVEVTTTTNTTIQEKVTETVSLVEASVPFLETSAPEAPGGGVEESKELVPEDIQPEADHDPGRGVEESKEVEEETTAGTGNSVAGPPGSWASLVARSGTSSAPPTPTPGTPARGARQTSSQKPSTAAKAAEKPLNAELKGSSAMSSSTGASAKSGEGTTLVDKNNANANTNNLASKSTRPRLPTSKRDPDMTLVIKNISPETTEADIRGLFEQFAISTDAKVMGCTVSSHRIVAFVDYSSPAAVLAAIEAHNNKPLVLHDQVLVLYQKTFEKTGGRHGGAPSGSIGGGSSSGGRQPRRGGGRGDRGGSGRGGRGGRSGQ